MNNKFLLSIVLCSVYSMAANSQTTLTNQTSPSNNSKNLSITPKPDLKVADPFARGVNKPVAYGTIPQKGGNAQPTPSSNEIETTEDNLRRLPDIRSYRLVGINSKRMAQKPMIVGPNLTYPSKGQAASQYYISLGSYNQIQYAKQYAWDFFQANRNFIDANFVIRSKKYKNKTMYQIDYGPFEDESYVRLLCQELTKHVFPPVKNCPIIKEFKSEEELASYTSTAMVGLSAGMIHLLSDSNFYDSKKLMGATFKVKEGDLLGAEGYTVMKIQRDGLYLGKLNSKTYFLPIDTLPFSPPESKDEAKKSPASPATR